MTRKIMRKVDNESENDQNDTKVVHTGDSDEKLRIVTSAKILKMKKMIIN
jgi:hypothetical protein